jgi:glycosyltransferase involved in cell wall biosynthesis
MLTRAEPAGAASSSLLPAGVEIILDLSRLISRILHPMPTGIDRVELVYARTLLTLVPEQLHFAAVNPFGFYGRLPREAVVHFLDEIEARWANETARPRRAMFGGAARTLTRLRPRRVPKAVEGIRRYYVQASPHHLDNEDRVAAKLRIENARFIALVHDLIPIEYPEYARPNGAATHIRRIRTMADLASGLIANSGSTAQSMARFLGESGAGPLIRVAHLGSDPLPEGSDPSPIVQPYFVVLSTIEPRKNHLLLLNIWRRMIETLGPERTPHLAIIGRRGWENENVIDMLERSTAIQGHIHEFSGLSDRMVGTLLRRARALLCPSFAEGFGMPVTEALLCGTPVICSDLPALREAGGSVPDFIDPLDGPEWIKAIMDYSVDAPGRRSQQIARLDGWTPPSWQGHIETVLKLIADIDLNGNARA